MGDPLAGMDMGPDDIFYEGPQKPVVFQSDNQNPHPIHQNTGGDLALRVARLEEQMRRLIDMAGLG